MHFNRFLTGILFALVLILSACRPVAQSETPLPATRSKPIEDFFSMSPAN
jgi:hypothetical protein